MSFRQASAEASHGFLHCAPGAVAEVVDLSQAYFPERDGAKEGQSRIFPGSDIDYSSLCTVDAKAVLKMVGASEIRAIEAANPTPAITVAASALLEHANPLAAAEFSKRSDSQSEMMEPELPMGGFDSSIDFQITT